MTETSHDAADFRSPTSQGQRHSPVEWLFYVNHRLSQTIINLHVASSQCRARKSHRMLLKRKASRASMSVKKFNIRLRERQERQDEEDDDDDDDDWDLSGEHATDICRQ